MADGLVEKGPRVIAIVAAQFAVTYLPPLQALLGTEPVPLADGLLIVSVGAAFFAIVGLFAVKFKEDKFKLVALAGLAGCAAGGVYWIVGHPSSSPLLIMGIGLIGGIVYAWAES